MDDNIIIEKSKTLAKYMGLQYIPFNDLQDYPKPGYWQTTAKTNLPDFIQFNPKNSWVKVGDKRAKFICRNHSELRYFNDYNSLMEVVSKLEKENLRDYFYKWQEEDEIRYNFEGLEISRFHVKWDVTIWLALDPPMEISKSVKYKDLPDRQQLFFVLVDAIEYINNLRHGR